MSSCNCELCVFAASAKAFNFCPQFVWFLMMTWPTFTQCVYLLDELFRFPPFTSVNLYHFLKFNYDKPVHTGFIQFHATLEHSQFYYFIQILFIYYRRNVNRIWSLGCKTTRYRVTVRRKLHIEGHASLDKGGKCIIFSCWIAMQY